MVCRDGNSVRCFDKSIPYLAYNGRSFEGENDEADHIEREHDHFQNEDDDQVHGALPFLSINFCVIHWVPRLLCTIFATSLLYKLL